MEQSTPSPNVRACCQLPSNLHSVETGKKDLTCNVCEVCGARHWELTVDPGVLGVRVAPLTGSPEDNDKAGREFIEAILKGFLKEEK